MLPPVFMFMMHIHSSSLAEARAKEYIFITLWNPKITSSNFATSLQAYCVYIIVLALHQGIRDSSILGAQGEKK